jgi:hypothetical protein
MSGLLVIWTPNFRELIPCASTSIDHDSETFEF